jgi:hypothetical protein
MTIPVQMREISEGRSVWGMMSRIRHFKFIGHSEVKGFFLSFFISASSLSYGAAVSNYKVEILKEIQVLQEEFSRKSTSSGVIAVKEVVLEDIQNQIQVNELEKYKATYLVDSCFLIEECTLLWRGLSGRNMPRNTRFMLAEKIGSRLWTLVTAQLSDEDLLPFGFWYNPMQSTTYAAGVHTVNTPCSLIIPIGQGRAFQLDGHSSE